MATVCIYGNETSVVVTNEYVFPLLMPQTIAGKPVVDYPTERAQGHRHPDTGERLSDLPLSNKLQKRMTVFRKVPK